MVVPSPSGAAGRRGFPRWVLGLLVLLAVWVLGFGACFAAAVAGFSASEGGGGGGWVPVLGVGSVALYIGGVVLAVRVGRRRRPTRAPASAPAVVPGVFVSCPGCGRQVNREVARCPYCQTLIEGGADG